jgi:hypothetical protein
VEAAVRALGAAFAREHARRILGQALERIDAGREREASGTFSQSSQRRRSPCERNFGSETFGIAMPDSERVWFAIRNSRSRTRKTKCSDAKLRASSSKPSSRRWHSGSRRSRAAASSWSSAARAATAPGGSAAAAACST